MKNIKFFKILNVFLNVLGAWALLSGCAPRLIGVKARLAAAAAAASSGTASVATFAVSVTGMRGLQAAVGDFDDDGDLDIVTANPSSNNVSVILGNGAGGFAAAVNYAVSNVPIAVAVDDLNRNGAQDLFVTTSNGDVEVLLGVGNGTFGAATVYAGVTGAAGITLGDFNNNGVTDAVFVDFVANQIHIKLGNIAGTLGAVANFAVGNAPVGIASGDFDHDGDLDVAVTNSTDNNVTVWLGNGAGAFAGNVNYAVGTTPLGIVAADFNRDGDLDLATANFGTANISILLGNGAGAFAAATNFAVGASPVSVVAADFNVNGVLDLAVTNSADSDVSILLGVGDGTFGVAADTATSTSPVAVVAGDFNRDGEPDAVVSELADGVPTLVSGTDPAAPGTFTDAANLAMGAGASPERVAIGDFDNDGDIDTVSVDMGNDRARVFFNNGAGVMAFNQDLATNLQPTGVAVADMDRDGDLDLVIACRGGGVVEVYKNDGTGNFTALVFDSENFYMPAGGNPWHVLLGDLNKDGAIDAAVVGEDFGNEAVVDVYTNDGTGNLTSVDQIVPAGPGVNQGCRDGAIGDIDNDGDLDLVYSIRDHDFVAVALNDGAAGFPANHNLTTTGAGSNPHGLRLHDINRDGDLDVLVTGGGAAFELMFMTGNGTGAVAAPVVFDSGGGTVGHDILALDYDFDGDLDYALIEQSSLTTGGELITGNGGTGTALVGDFPGGTCTDSRYGEVADFNRDGRPDYIVGCYGDDNLSLYTGN